MDRKVLLIDVDDVGLALLDQACDTGGAPNLARLRAIGMDFRNFWAAPLCSPFRAQVLTGLVANRSGSLVGGLVDEEGSFAGPTGEWITYKMPGYKTKRGKVHLVADQFMPAAMVGEYRYDEFSGVTGNLFNAGSHNYRNWQKLTAVANGETTRETCTTFATNDTAAAVLSDIAGGADFIHASFNAVHAPCGRPDDGDPLGRTYVGRTYNERRADLLYHLDAHLGECIDEAVTAGYIVFVMGDNGSGKAGKGTMYERGLNTPLLVVGDGVRQGTSLRLVSAVDIFATVRYLRGAVELENHDGVNFADEFLDIPATEKPRTTMAVVRFPNPGTPPDPSVWQRAVRDVRWKLIDTPAADPEAGEEPQEFFDLLSDPTERNNLLLGELTPQQAAAYEALTAALPSL